MVPVHVNDAVEEMKQVQKHPKVSQPVSKSKLLLAVFTLLATGFTDSWGLCPQKGCKVLWSGCLLVWPVCLFVCLFTCISQTTTRPSFTRLSVHVTYGCGSVLLWWQCDLLCNFSFVNDVMFSYNERIGQIKHDTFHPVCQIAATVDVRQRYLVEIASWRHQGKVCHPTASFFLLCNP